MNEECYKEGNCYRCGSFECWYNMTEGKEDEVPAEVPAEVTVKEE